MRKNFHRQLLISLISISLVSISILATATYVRGFQTLTTSRIEGVNYIQNYLRASFEQTTKEAQKVTDHLEHLVIDTINPNALNDRQYLATYLEGLAPEISRIAQNHHNSHTAYFYLNPELTFTALDVFFADQDGDGSVERQDKLPLSYFLNGPTEEDDKSWWFGPQLFREPYWTTPYSWTFDNDSHTKLISHTKAVYINNVFIGVVGTDIFFSAIETVMNQSSSDLEGVTFLLSKDYIPIYYPGSASIDDLILKYRQFSTVNLEGESISLSSGDWLLYTKELHNGWILGLQLDKQKVLLPLKQYSLTILVAMLIAFFVALIIAHFLSKTLSKPLKELVYAISQHSDIYSPLNLSDMTLKRKDDIGAVARALKQMGEDINKHMLTIENQRKSLKYIQERDELTHLPNKDYLFHNATNILSDLQQQEHLVIVMNIDNFRLLNGMLGVEQCNRILIEFGKRLITLSKKAKLIARTSGDEFTLIYPKEDATDHFLLSLQSLVSGVYLLAKDDIHLSVSIGVSIFPTHGTSIEHLLKNASIALNQVKNGQKNTYLIYNPKIGETSNEQFELLKRLRDAIINDAMEIYYQPQYNSTTNEIVGIEALVRWPFEERFIAPSEFIPLAEESKLIIPLGDQIFDKVFRFSHYLSSLGISIKMSVNISSDQITWRHLYHRLMHYIEKYTIDPHMIVLEITESLLANGRKEAQDVLSALHREGFGIAIDDFGTGYSSLSYLKSIPFSTLKLDRSFIKDYPDFDDGEIAKMIISLANSLNATVVAEGMENQAQRDYLIACGCSIMQGFFYSKPLSETDLIELLLAQKAHSTEEQ